MKFIDESKGDKIEMELHEHATVPEVLEFFERFLRACGYIIPYDETIELIEKDE